MVPNGIRHKSVFLYYKGVGWGGALKRMRRRAWCYCVPLFETRIKGATTSPLFGFQKFWAFMSMGWLPRWLREMHQQLSYGNRLPDHSIGV